MPFLYQTTTLAGAFKARSPEICRRICRRNISYTSRAYFAAYNQKPRISYPSLEPKNKKRDTNSDSEGTNQIKIIRTGYAHVNIQREQPAVIGKNLGGIRKVWAEHPEVYNADDRHHFQSRGRVPRRDEDEFNEFGEMENIEFQRSFAGAEAESYEEMDAIDALTIRRGAQARGESTITVKERQAFQRIFEDIFTQYQSSSKPLEGDLYFEDGGESSALGSPGTKKETSIGRIMGDATKKQLEEMVDRYPEPLRAAASRAVGLDRVGEQPTTEVVPEESPLQKRLVELQNAEQLRVETLMRKAETDVELWSILETEVFPLIAKLGLGEVNEEPPIAPILPTKKKASKKGKKSKKTTNVEEPPAKPVVFKNLEAEAGISALELYGPLYPSYLLLALRLLDRSFISPSPLTLVILPKIKSLGLISRVLGATTQLYNELINIYFHRRDDFTGVRDLLAEMEASGLAWDEETLQLIKEIRHLQVEVAKGERGETTMLFFGMPEFGGQTFTSWIKRIEESLGGSREYDEDEIDYAA